MGLAAAAPRPGRIAGGSGYQTSGGLHGPAAGCSLGAGPRPVETAGGGGALPAAGRADGPPTSARRSRCGLGPALSSRCASGTGA